MAENPITSDNLTIDFGTLLSMTVGDRVQAATSNPGFQNLLMNSLTPIQLAKAFPSYYRDKLPDISNFILANRYLDEKGSAEVAVVMVQKRQDISKERLLFLQIECLLVHLNPHQMK